MKFLPAVIVALIVLLSNQILASEAEDTARREIEYLINFVAISGCAFQRNGSTHDPEDAADHLRLKYRRGGRHVDTAEHFIDRLATESSWTGRDYTVTCGEQVLLTGPWLHQTLNAFRASEATATAPGA